MVAQVLGSFWDPTGYFLAGPTVLIKLSMAKSYEQNNLLKWDDVIPENAKRLFLLSTDYFFLYLQFKIPKKQHPKSRECKILFSFNVRCW